LFHDVELTIVVIRSIITANVNGLPLCWYFITVSRQPQPIEKLVMKLATKARKNSFCRILADGCTNADCSSARQHSAAPNVGCSFILLSH